MWQGIHSIFAKLSSVVRGETANNGAPSLARENAASRSGIKIVSILLEDQDRSLIAEICGRNEWEVFFAKTCQVGRDMSELLQPQIILLDRDLADGDWRTSVYACASSSAGVCTLLISRVADDYLWNEVVCNGGYDVLPKPLREQDVLRAVKFAWSYWNSMRHAATVPRK